MTKRVDSWVRERERERERERGNSTGRNERKTGRTVREEDGLTLYFSYWES